MASNGHNGAGRIPTIGIPCARDKSQRYYGLPIFIQNTTYLRAITDGGAAPIIIPLQLDEATLRVIYETVDGIFLPGGEDMDPAQYDEAQHEMLGATDAERDRTEMLLGRWALEDHKPVIAICRGAQVLNVIQGGSLYQDIRALREGSERHDYFPPQFERVRISHEVRFEPHSRLARIFGPSTMVNSMHHQAVKTLGVRCQPIAWAPDGVVEAIEVADHPFALGVQWHPEELATHLLDAPSRQLFADFVEQCRQHAAARGAF
ncbi:MAG: gamma-glutamyl-gamma-aminobutyrate hydrolase family protein [Anaerolinea sp.]|nr:gamma-glutamyl-gamma-aminobutyrate hydrolase family protein [Anaerolinea sp.]HRI57142.1 gamma-glutamyl-gamma-aminobutyrate hydrolase family protein [Anaerolineae bacterium]